MSTHIYENTVMSAQHASTEQTNPQQAETNIYEGLQQFQAEPSKKQNHVNNCARSDRKYVIIAVVVVAVVCIGLGVAVGFASAAWKNSIQTQGVFTNGMIILYK